MTVQCGDVISLDIDDWQVNGRKFNVLSAKYRENSSAAELVLEDQIDHSTYAVVVDRKAIISDNEMD